MKARLLFSVLLLVLLSGAGLLAFLARTTPEQPIGLEELVAEGEPPGLAAGFSPGLPDGRGRVENPPPTTDQARPPFDRPPPPIDRAPIPSGDRDELFADSPARPEPGAFDGPLVSARYEDGMPYFEAEQILGPDGIWLLNGRWTSWFENGQLQEQGWYEEQQEAGDWQWWDENGQQIAQGSFLGGQREGVWTFWYSNGARQMDARYASGQGQGLWTLYYDDASKWAEGQYRDGEISGYWTIWDEFGVINPERSGVYEAGSRISD